MHIRAYPEPPNGICETLCQSLTIMPRPLKTRLFQMPPPPPPPLPSSPPPPLDNFLNETLGYCESVAGEGVVRAAGQGVVRVTGK